MGEAIPPEPYYRRHCGITFKAHEPAYEHVLGKLKLPQNDKVCNFVLGGVHCLDLSGQQFISFCQKIHPNPNDRHIILDKNLKPLLQDGRRNKISDVLQADLTSLPLLDRSVDLVFLDHTLNFMTDNDVRKACQQLSRIIQPEGLVLATLSMPALPFITSFWESRVNRAKTYLRSFDRIISLMSPLKPVIIASAETDSDKNFGLIALTSKESHLPAHQGDPFSYLLST